MRVAIHAALLALLWQGVATPAPPADPAGAGQVKSAPPAVQVMRSGATDTLRLVFQVAPGLHVQAHPAADAFLIPLTLELEAAAGLELGPVVYPPPQIHRLADTGAELLVCAGTVSIAIPVMLTAMLPDGSATVRGTLRWQACDAKRCFAPRSTPVELRITAAH